VETFLVSNLYGAGVATGQSAFKPADFRKARRVLRADMRLGVDPWVPFAAGSYRITSEGLPARRETYVEGGRLVRPIVGLKYARRLRTEPSTPPISMESVFLEAGATTGYRAALRRLEGGLVVLSALGLHTQDTASGDFSLTAPQAIVVRGGRAVESVKAVLAGNFYRALEDARTRLVRMPGSRFPGLIVHVHAAAG
jgi:PmbA protein